MSTIIAINNHKGGVAKTTTCLSLGACLAELGQTVLLVDLDPQAHLTVSLGLQSDKLHRTVTDAILANTSLLSITRESSVFGLDIAPSNRELALVDKILYRQKRYEYLLKQRLATMNGSYYDFILLDCAPAFGSLTLNALTAADLLIIPMQCEFYAAHSLRQIIKLAKLTKRKTNPDLCYQVLATMYDQRNKICRLILAHMQRELSPIMYKTVIGIDTKLRESPAYGRPITVYAPQTRGANQYRALAKELLNHAERRPARQTRGALLRPAG